VTTGATRAHPLGPSLGHDGRCPDAGLLHHSDQGATYASEDYQRVLDVHVITCSMSRRGDCYDNAVMEAFFSSLKSELADRFPNGGEAKRELFDYIEVFYNQRRRYSTFGQISLAEFEQLAARHLFLPAKRTGRTAINVRHTCTEADQGQGPSDRWRRRYEVQSRWHPHNDSL
jgi:transposase InsO family protein